MFHKKVLTTKRLNVKKLESFYTNFSRVTCTIYSQPKMFCITNQFNLYIDERSVPKCTIKFLSDNPFKRSGFYCKKYSFQCFPVKSEIKLIWCLCLMGNSVNIPITTNCYTF